MVRAHVARVALAAALGLACGCSTSSSCCGCPGSSFTSRLTSWFRHDRVVGEVVESPGDGPVVVDPGEVPGFGTVPPPETFTPPPPQTFTPPPPQPFTPPLVPTPRPLPPGTAQPMPYQPPQ
ncbi:MAG TPA: hypothetical protein VKA46_04410 [Gemmataceae bacterium]|nr:hypothetical protein [Gemmataceae bacterium]